MTSLRSITRKLIGKHNFVTIVSGLPRSGTSMMMAALATGGMPLLTDGLRTADENNPRGYYEYEKVKKLPEGETRWLSSARGKAVKVISALLLHLPDRYMYRVIFMERHIDEILASQTRMLARNAIEDQVENSEEEVRTSFMAHLSEMKSWMKEKENIRTLYVSYNEILSNPQTAFKEIAGFLDGLVDPEAMMTVVDPNLYRERANYKEREEIIDE